MIRSRVSRGAAALALALGSAGTVGAQVVAATDTPSTASVDAVLTEHYAEADLVREGQFDRAQAKSASTVNAQAEVTSSALSDVQAFADAGLRIMSSVTTVSETRVVSRDRAGLVSVETEVTTLVESSWSTGEVVESSWTDARRLTLVDSRGDLTIRDDVVVDPPAPVQYNGPPVPLPSLDARSSAEPGSEDLDLSMGILSQPALNATAFRDYALKWTKYPNHDKINPVYPDTGNNCANFASQSLRAGGWALKNGVNARDTNNWHYNLTGPAGASRTWSEAKTLYYYATAKQSWPKLSSIWSARTGDMLFVDWDPNGRADGQIDHVMVVTGYGVSDTAPYQTVPLISQKSPNRSNIPLTQSIRRAQDSGKTSLVWYGLKRR